MEGVYTLGNNTPDTKKNQTPHCSPSEDEITDAQLEKAGQEERDSTKMESSDKSVVIVNQPRPANRKKAHSSFHSPFNDANSERDWATGLRLQQTEKRTRLMQCCCWPAYRYSLAIRLGETPFMPIIPCAVFALRIKIRTLFGIKGSLIKDFFTAMCCEPCAVCQMTREMDQIGL